MSVFGSVPTTLAGSSRPSASSTFTVIGLADHVVVGHHVAGAVDDEAAALAHGAARRAGPCGCCWKKRSNGRAAQFGRQLGDLLRLGMAGDADPHHGRADAGGEIGEIRPGRAGQGDGVAGAGGWAGCASARETNWVSAVVPRASARAPAATIFGTGGFGHGLRILHGSATRTGGMGP